jgi:hypothetical protein
MRRVRARSTALGELLAQILRARGSAYWGRRGPNVAQVLEFVGDAAVDIPQHPSQQTTPGRPSARACQGCLGFEGPRTSVTRTPAPRYELSAESACDLWPSPGPART